MSERKEAMETAPESSRMPDPAAPVKKIYPADKRMKAFQPRVPGYLLFLLMEAFGISLIGSLLQMLLSDDLQHGGTVLAALFMLLVNRLYCLPWYRGMLTFKNFGKGMAMGALFCGICILLNFLSSLQSGLIHTGFLKALLLSMEAGFTEEVIFRGPGIANFMRVTDDEKKIPLIFWISSLSFGLMHLTNFLAGADLLMTVVQVISACSVGMLFAAIFLRTGNLWPCIIYHTLIDLACFVSEALLATDGLVTMSITLLDWIYTAVSIPMAIAAIRMISKKHRGEILAVWAERWNKPSSGQQQGSSRQDV